MRRSDIGSVFSAIRTTRPVPGNENRIQGNVGVVHPEGDRLILHEVEQHAPALRQFLAKHQTARPLRLVCGKFDAERMHPALADNIERQLAGGVQRRAGEGDKLTMKRSRAANAARGTKDAKTTNSTSRANRARTSEMRDPLVQASGRTSAAIKPLGPGPKRTSTNWPGRS